MKDITTSQVVSKKGKIQWLSILQGLCMALVVVDHIRLCHGEIMSWSPVLNKIIESFLMPLFMFISGWLFCMTCIRKEKSYKEVLKSKFIRLGIPFFAFSIMATLVKLPLPFLMHRPVDSEEIVNTFILYSSNPLFELWFITTLFEIIMLYPLFRIAVKSRLGAITALMVALAVYYFLPKDIVVFRLNYVKWMLIYFTVGVLSYNFKVVERVNGWLPIVVSLGLFVALYQLDLEPHRGDLPLSLAGIFFLVAVCRKVAEYHPSLFSSFRDYTYQIFLMGIFFQMPIRWVFNALHQNWLYIPFYIVSLLAGIYLPTLIAKYLKKKAPQYIKMCFGLT